MQERLLVWRDNLHTVCHLGGANDSLPLAAVEVIGVGEAVDQGVGNGDRLAPGRAKDWDVVPPGRMSRIGGVSGFLLPTFLCRCKEK